MEDGGRLLLLPVTGSDSNWYRNIIKTPEISLTADGKELSATAKLIKDPPAVEEAVEKFAAKYGADRVQDYYPKHDVAVEIPLS